MENVGRLLITGDTHGDKPALAMMAKQFQPQDILFVAGDFGYLFWDDCEENGFLTDVDLFLRKKDIWIVVIPGNHENYRAINRFPVEKWAGAAVRRIRQRIIYVERGEILTLKSFRFPEKNIKIFCFGGAFSIDRAYRQLNKSYWAEEIPTDADYANGNRNLNMYENKVDYVISHTCPIDLVPCLGKYHACREEVPLQNYLQYVAEVTESSRKLYYFGHWHVDMNLGQYKAIFADIYDLETGVVI